MRPASYHRQVADSLLCNVRLELKVKEINGQENLHSGANQQ